MKIVNCVVGILVWALLWSCREREKGIFTITGEVKGITQGCAKIYTCPPENLLLDSCEIRDGKYFLQGKMKEPQAGILFLEKRTGNENVFGGMAGIFLESADMQVDCDAAHVKNTLKISQAPMNEELQLYEAYLAEQPEQKKVAEYSNRIQQAFLEARMDDVRAWSRTRDSLQLVSIDRLMEKFPQASHSPVAAYTVYRLTGSMNWQEREKSIRGFSAELRDSYYLNLMRTSIATESALQPGRPFPDFDVFDRDGKHYTLKDFQGKYVFLEFSASWCGWCKKEVPFIREAYEALKDKNIVFVTFMMDEKRENWLNEMDTHHIDWLCLSDLKGMKESPLVKAYNLGGLPDSFVIDPEGKVIHRDLRGKEVIDFLTSLVD